jgi:hypothetical protein
VLLSFLCRYGRSCKGEPKTETIFLDEDFQVSQDGILFAALFLFTGFSRWKSTFN